MKGLNSTSGTQFAAQPLVNPIQLFDLRASSSNDVPIGLIGSLSNNVFERRTSTGSGLFSFFDGGFAQIFSQIASITVKKLGNTNFISSRHVKRENTSLPVDVRRSKTSLLKLPNNSHQADRPGLSFFSPVFAIYEALQKTR